METYIVFTLVILAAVYLINKIRQAANGTGGCSSCGGSCSHCSGHDGNSKEKKR